MKKEEYTVVVTNNKMLQVVTPDGGYRQATGLEGELISGPQIMGDKFSYTVKQGNNNVVYIRRLPDTSLVSAFGV
jgi:hypothetical protein